MCNAAKHIKREEDLLLAGAAEAAIIQNGMGGFSTCKAVVTGAEKCSFVHV